MNDLQTCANMVGWQKQSTWIPFWLLNKQAHLSVCININNNKNCLQTKENKLIMHGYKISALCSEIVAVIYLLMAVVSAVLDFSWCWSAMNFDVCLSWCEEDLQISFLLFVPGVGALMSYFASALFSLSEIISIIGYFQCVYMCQSDLHVIVMTTKIWNSQHSKNI
jgi:hypothetical protein